jgi:hypothetical protein
LNLHLIGTKKASTSSFDIFLISGSLFAESTYHCKTPPPSRVPSFCSTYSGVRRRKESVISSVTSQGAGEADFVNKEEEEDYNDDDLHLTPAPKENRLTSCWHSLSQLIGLYLCKDPRFIIVVISVMSMSVGEYNISTFSGIWVPDIQKPDTVII